MKNNFDWMDQVKGRTFKKRNNLAKHQQNLGKSANSSEVTLYRFVGMSEEQYRK